VAENRRAVGEPCANSYECGGNNTYCKVGASCPGRCALLEEPGQLCQRDIDCSGSSFCSTTTQRCTVAAKLNEPCGGTEDARCDAGLSCAGGGVDVPGKCLPFEDTFAVPAGETCTVDGTAFCGANLSCLYADAPICVATVARGAACEVAFPDMCPADEYCLTQTFDSKGGVCTSTPQAGESCSDSVDPQKGCARGLSCDGASCRARQPLGGACEGDWACRSGWCIGGTCSLAGTCTGRHL
jgi:hypothetical protein